MKKIRFEMRYKEKIEELNDEHSEVYDVVLEFPFYFQHLNEVLNHLAPQNNGIYLDLGCGTGNLLALARDNGYTFIGVDLSSGMLKKAKEKGIENLVKADVTRLPFRNDCFDGITSVNVLYQLKEPNKFLQEIYRVLKASGKIILSTPYERASLNAFLPEFLKSIIKNPRILKKMKDIVGYYKINKKIIDQNPEIFHITKQKLEEIVKESGFEIEETKKVYVDQNWLVVAKKPNSLQER